MPTLTINVQANDGSPSVSTSYNVTAVGEIKYQGSIPDTTSSAGQLVKMTFAHADVAGVYLLSTQNMSIHTNSDGSPDDTIPMTANVPIDTNPFTAHDITALYLRNASMTTAATVTMIILVNSSVS